MSILQLPRPTGLRKAIEKSQKVVAEWLKQMGLEMKPSKTKIVHTLEIHDGQVGFDFLGFNIRQYPRGKNQCMHDTHGRPLGFTTTIAPSKESQKRFLPPGFSLAVPVYRMFERRLCDLD